MTKILIDAKLASDAIVWACKNFGSAFNVHHDFPSEKYRFEFDNDSQASMFALKWM